MINQTLKAGVIGWPINHSLSPFLHRFWLKEHSIQGEYLPLAVSSEKLEGFIRGLAENGWCGINVTLPHKQAALELVDDLDPIARRIGAINTIVVMGDGSLKGINTDGYGFFKNLQEFQSEWEASDKPVVVLGAGGAARAVLMALIESGSSEIRLVNRNQSRAKNLAAEFNGPIRVYNWSDRSAILSEARLLVNTTSLGMRGQAPLKIDLKNLPLRAVVNDIVYTPIETELLKNAERRGNRTVDGLGMLLHQARVGFSAWFGVDPSVSSALRAHVLNAMKI
jgi:shikimate dehydrogenase